MGDHYTQAIIGPTTNKLNYQLGVPTTTIFRNGGMSAKLQLDSDFYSSDDGQSNLMGILIKSIIGFILVMIILISILGNILVCLAISTDRRLRKIGNLFIASLALADLLLAMLVMTFAVANDLLGYWMFGQVMCEIWIALDISCCK